MNPILPSNNIPFDSEEQLVFPKVKQNLKEMPLLGFGTFIGIEHKKIQNLERRRQVVEASVFEALRAGYRHFDCASNYGNLKWIGNALMRAFLPESEGGLGIKREEVWITSKDPMPSAENLKITLEALNLDYLDLYLLHFPHSKIEDIWKEMNGLVDQGVVKNIGVSNFYRFHMERLLRICEEQNLRLPYADEIEISPWVQEEEFDTYCKQWNIRLIAYSPLSYVNSSSLLQLGQLTDKASRLNATAAQIALAWNMARGITVIPSSQNEAHIQSNAAAVNFIEDLARDQEFMASMKEANLNLCSTDTADKFKNSLLF